MSELRTAVIAGASGYIGQYLRNALEGDGVQVRTIGRGVNSDAQWSDPQSVASVLQGSDLLINLAGRSVSCRYNKRNADQIFTSRTVTTAALGQAISTLTSPPELWVNASTGTIYRDARDRPMNELTGELGTGFSVAVARAWEHELFTAPTPVRKVALRMSIVLGAGGGAINPFINLARIGCGGRMGDGEQVFSWVHVDDVPRTIVHLFEHQEISGAVNVAAPEHVTNTVLMSEIRDALGLPWGAPTPRWMLEFGARVIRTEAELVLKSRWVESKVLADSGFEFAYPTLREALAQIANNTRRGLLPVALG
jgi:uncharacterized protein (TIGR01777 family)